MRATMLFPGDFYSLNNVNDNFSAEVDAAVSCDCFDVLLFNFDEYIDGAPLKLNKPAKNCSKSLVYRGWMMKPKEYERLYSDLVKLGFDPITKPGSYEKMHCFPNAATSFVGQTPNILVFPAQDGKVEVDASLINSTFDRFLIKDYVKSVKGSSFPSSIQTPVTQEEIDELVKRFVELRGPLFTGGIVIKEYVELKRYGKATNEWREFKFIRGSRVSLERNSNQPKDCPKPPEDYLMTRNQVIAPFYTVDYAELEDGSWTIVEVGDGGVSGLAASADPAVFYGRMASILAKIHPVPDGVSAVNYKAFDELSDVNDVREWLVCHPGESALAYCYAFAHNRSGELMHGEEDFEGDELLVAERQADSWYDLEEELANRIICQLRRENAEPQADGTYYKCAPFMARNGYSDGCGWWTAE